MSKKDFIALADAIREHNRIALNRLANGDTSVTPFTDCQLDTIADFCKRQNSAFLTSRWLGYIAGLNGQNGGAIRK